MTSSWFKVLSRLYQSNFCDSMNQISNYLKLSSGILLLKIIKFWGSLCIFDRFSRLNFIFLILADLHNEILMGSLSESDRPRELQYDCNLRLIAHWQDKSFYNGWKLNLMTKSTSMKSKVFSIKVNCVLAPWYDKIDFRYSRNRFSCKTIQLRLLSDHFQQTVWSCFFITFWMLFRLLQLFRLHVKSQLHQRVIISYILVVCFNYKVIFWNGCVYYFRIVNHDNILLFWREGTDGKNRRLLVDFTKVNSFHRIDDSEYEFCV